MAITRYVVSKLVGEKWQWLSMRGFKASWTSNVELAYVYDEKAEAIAARAAHHVHGDGMVIDELENAKAIARAQDTF